MQAFPDPNIGSGQARNSGLEACLDPRTQNTFERSSPCSLVRAWHERKITLDNFSLYRTNPIPRNHRQLNHRNMAFDLRLQKPSASSLSGLPFLKTSRRVFLELVSDGAISSSIVHGSRRTTGLFIGFCGSHSNSSRVPTPVFLEKATFESRDVLATH